MQRWAARLLILLTLVLSNTVSVKAGSTEVTGVLSLTISNIAAGNITTSAATITWETNGDSTSQVFYGDEAGDYQFHTPVLDTSPNVSRHSVNLSGLFPDRTYHFQVQSTVTGSSLITTVSGDYSFTTGKNSASSGSGSPAGTKNAVQTVELTSTGNLTVDSAGIVQQTVRLETRDHSAALMIPDGTSLRDAQGRPLDTIYARKIDEMPAAPPVGSVVLAYDLGPSGARFNPPLTLTLRYDPAQLPPGSPENSLRIVYWEETHWVEVSGAVDTASHTVSARLSHFSLYFLVSQKIPEGAAAAPESTLPPENQPASITAVEPTPEASTSQPTGPVTGPVPPVSILILAGVIAAAAVVYLILRRNPAG